MSTATLEQTIAKITSEASTKKVAAERVIRDFPPGRHLPLPCRRRPRPRRTAGESPARPGHVQGLAPHRRRPPDHRVRGNDRASPGHRHPVPRPLRPVGCGVPHLAPRACGRDRARRHLPDHPPDGCSHPAPRPGLISAFTGCSVKGMWLRPCPFFCEANKTNQIQLGGRCPQDNSECL